MAPPPRLGNLFLLVARRPLWISSERFAGNFLGDGVRAVARVPMILALQQAVMEVAKASGAAPAEVDRALPAVRIGELAARIDERQKTALAAIRRNDLTMTDFGRPASKTSPATQMIDVAEHFARDKPIADSLRALSTEIAAWEELLGECGALLDADQALTSRYRTTQTVRRVLRVGVWGLAAIAAAVLVGGYWKVQAERAAKEREAAAAVERQAASRRRLDAVFEGNDPCAVATEEDLVFATSVQRAKIEERKVACERHKQVMAEQAACKDAAESIGRGQLPATLPRALPPELAKRLAEKTLLPEDLLVSTLPCGDVLWKPLVDAASGSADLWGRTDGVSKEMATRLRAAWAELPPAPAVHQTIAFRAETVAIAATLKGTPEALAGAIELCAMKADKSPNVGISCRAILAKRAQ